MANAPTIINGKSYDFSSITAAVADSVQTLGVKEISFNDKLDPGKVRGTTSQVLARTRGQYDASGSMTLYLEDAAALRASLAPGYKEKEFDITLEYADFGLPTQTRILHRCRITGDDESHSNGNDALVAKFDLDIIQIERDGEFSTTDYVL